MREGKTAITFKQYLQRRGYDYMSFSEVMYRMVPKSFSETSFRRFWRMWNPFTGYIAFLIYSFLTGSLKQPYRILFVFTISGVVFHDFFIFLITGSLSIIFTVTFFLYSIIFNVEEMMDKRRKLKHADQVLTRKLPVAYFVGLNMVLLSLPLAIGIVINYYVLPDSVINNIFR